MSYTISLALFSWPAIVMVLFGVMPARRAIVVGIVGGWLFLPMSGFSFTGLPAYTKVEATAYGALLGVLAFDFSRVTTLRLGWLDIPIVVWCLVPLASSVTNGLGVYDGVSAIFTQSVTWGVPYFLGRLYFVDLEGLRELAIGIFLGGLIYVPLCLIEMRMSPRLHIWIYGIHQHNWRQAARFGGWRPTVFMQHGLAVAFWMAISGVVGYWLWRTRALIRVHSIPMSALVLAVLGTAVACRSAGAVAIVVLSVLAFELTRLLKQKFILICLAVAPVCYVGVRSMDLWDGSHLLRVVHSVPILSERAQSLEYRMQAEEILAGHAAQRPVFGWAGWSRNRPSSTADDPALDIATDGLWIIAYGQRGWVGLLALISVVLLPVAVVLRRYPAAFWWHPQSAPLAAALFVLILFMVDSLFNAMTNPILMLCSGGAVGFLCNKRVREGLGTRRGSAFRRSGMSSALSSHSLPSDSWNDIHEVGAGR